MFYVKQFEMYDGKISRYLSRGDVNHFIVKHLIRNGKWRWTDGLLLSRKPGGNLEDTVYIYNSGFQSSH